jgi:hypothetical protein
VVDESEADCASVAVDGSVGAKDSDPTKPLESGRTLSATGPEFTKTTDTLNADDRSGAFDFMKPTELPSESDSGIAMELLSEVSFKPAEVVSASEPVGTSELENWPVGFTPGLGPMNEFGSEPDESSPELPEMTTVTP